MKMLVEKIVIPLIFRRQLEMGIDPTSVIIEPRLKISGSIHIYIYIRTNCLQQISICAVCYLLLFSGPFLVTGHFLNLESKISIKNDSDVKILKNYVACHTDTFFIWCDRTSETKSNNSQGLKVSCNLLNRYLLSKAYRYMGVSPLSH